MEIVLVVFSIIFIAISFIPLLPSSHWTVRVWEFPRLQIATLLAVLLVVYTVKAISYTLSVLDVMLMLGLAVSLLYQCMWIIPYTPLYKREVRRVAAESKETLSILSSNVYMPNDGFQKLLSHVHSTQPDFLVTLESNKKWQDHLSELEEDYPHQKFCPLENLYGMHVYSKYAFENVTLRFLIEDDVPSIRATINVDGQKVTLYFLHPKPPSPTENEYAKPRDIELHVVGKEISKQNGPIIVAGDLNDVAWSPTTRHFKKISGLLDPREGRGFFNTFHAHYPLVKWPLDHVFHSKHFSLVRIERLSDIGSDHYPLFTQLALVAPPNRD